MNRLAIAAAVAAAAVAAGVTAPPTGARSACTIPLHKTPGWEAIFGVRSSRSAAESLRTKATRAGFQNLVIERVGCARWAVALHGLKDKRQGQDLAAEASSANFTVTLRCRPVLDLDGDWQAVFGRFATRTAAEAMRTKATRAGFKNLKILRDICTRRYMVELDGIKSLRQAREFQAEAKSAGFAVTIKHH